VSVARLRHVAVIDADAETVEEDQQIRIENGIIAEVSRDPGTPVASNEIDGRDWFAVPGLIDGHVHVNAISADLGGVANLPPSYVAVHAINIMQGMLARGFTTVRDVGGADHGLSNVVDEGLFPTPRLVYGGKALSATGGHGDLRPPHIEVQDDHYFRPGLSRICDGITAARHAVRDEIRRGASHIKIMLSGGCASPTDRIDSLQFSDDEVRAIVSEAASAHVYCAGHTYTAEAVNRALRLGVRSIEHGNMIDDESVALLREHEAFLVPTLITNVALAEQGTADGLPEDNLRKVVRVRDEGLRALERADQGGVSIVFGSDLLGRMHHRQSEEFLLRSEVQSPAAVLRSATTIAARLLRMDGQIGVLAPSARADVILTTENPLEKLSALAEPSIGIPVVIRNGQIVKDYRQ